MMSEQIFTAKFIKCIFYVFAANTNNINIKNGKFSKSIKNTQKCLI